MKKSSPTDARIVGTGTSDTGQMQPGYKIYKVVQYVSAGLLIGFGWAVEVYWYWFRFVSDGNPGWAALAQGIALTLFLSSAVGLKKSLFRNALIFMLVIYSVFATAAGQSYNLELVRIANSEQQIAQKQAQRQIERIDSRITDNDTEVERLEEIKRTEAETLADQSMWRTALANLNEDIAEYEQSTKELQRQKLEIINTGEVKPDDIYTRYADLWSVPVEIVQTVFQLTFSLFIALMAPVGLYMWPRPEVTPEVTPQVTPEVTPTEKLEEEPDHLEAQKNNDNVNVLSFLSSFWPIKHSSPMPTVQQLERSGYNRDKQSEILKELKEQKIAGVEGGKVVPLVYRDNAVDIMRIQYFTP